MLHHINHKRLAVWFAVLCFTVSDLFAVRWAFENKSLGSCLEHGRFEFSGAKARILNIGSQYCFPLGFQLMVGSMLVSSFIHK